MATKFTLEHFNQFGAGYLPHHLAIVITSLSEGRLSAELDVVKFHLAPNGYLHAGTVVSLADTCAGYACIAHLPEGASGFTTIELKSNHLGTARSGLVECVATSVHLGRTTQVWDATVTSKESGKTIALYRCTQMILYPKA
jgi:uncharacterized protein (TIGR00369 family)